MIDNLVGRFENSVMLDTHYEHVDAVTAGCIMDYDFDKQKELFVGNYQGVVTCYKLNKDTDKYEIIFTLTLEDPIMSMAPVDVYNVFVGI